MNDSGVRYEGDWVYTDDADKGRERDVDHNKYWNRALDSALAKVPVGEEGPFEVHRYVSVKHSSPGWFDGYKTDLST